MDAEVRSTLVMGILLLASQLAALAIAPAFLSSGAQAFSNPNDVSNAAVYIVAILVFTGLILLLVRFRKEGAVRILMLASVFITVSFVLIVPIYYILYYVPIEFDLTTFTILDTVLPFLGGILITWALIKYPEWYMVDAVGLLVAAGVTAILGISFGWFPAFILLVAMACYDAWAVYHTKHMITLADAVTSQNLPVLLVVPKHADYKSAAQPGLKERLEKGEEREAMFIGLGDLIIPGMMSVSAWYSFQDVAGAALPGLTPNLTLALGTLIGSLFGFSILMRYVLRGNPQAGLPLLNGGALAGFFLTNFLVFRTIIPTIPRFF